MRLTILEDPLGIGADAENRRRDFFDYNWQLRPRAKPELMTLRVSFLSRGRIFGKLQGAPALTLWGV